MIDRRIALAREWDELIEHVRRLGGFENFLRSPKMETLLTVAKGGPVVIVNVSPWRCDALIVTPDGLRVEELPDLTLKAASEQADIYLRTLQTAESTASEYIVAKEVAQSRPSYGSNRALQRAATTVMAAATKTDDMLRNLQSWLWETIAFPVLNALHLRTRPLPSANWPRVWWCPTGPLTLLPLHAAGYHSEVEAAVPRTVMDGVVSSYTPTLRALLEARADATNERTLRVNRAGTTSGPSLAPECDELDRILAVMVEDAPGAPRLRGVALEREMIVSRFSEQVCTLIEGPKATLETVIHELPRHRWAHFSCHGDQNLADPSKGGILLHDGVLTVADVAARRFRGEFASLSACKTAVGGVKLLDEIITLAAALHYTGYRHVIATLWTVDDATATHVFDAVYRRIARDGRLNAADAADAIHNAVRELRSLAPDEPRIWTPFIHIGP